MKDSQVVPGRRRGRDERSSHEAQSCGAATDALVGISLFLVGSGGGEVDGKKVVGGWPVDGLRQQGVYR